MNLTKKSELIQPTLDVKMLFGRCYDVKMIASTLLKVL